MEESKMAISFNNAFAFEAASGWDTWSGATLAWVPLQEQVGLNWDKQELKVNQLMPSGLDSIAGQVQRSYDKVSGTIKMVLHATSGIKLLKDIFQKTVVDAQVGTTAAYTHTMGFDSAPSTYGWNFAMIMDGAGDGETIRVFNAFINKATFDFDEKNVVTVSLSFVARSAAYEDATLTPSYTDALAHEYFVGAKSALTLGGSSVVTDKLTLVIDNGQTENSYLGSDGPKGMEQTKKRTVTGTVSVDWTDQTYIDLCQANTTTALEITTDTEELIEIGEVNTYKAVFTVPAIRLTKLPMPKGTAPMKTDLAFELIDNQSDEPITVVVTNKTATL